MRVHFTPPRYAADLRVVLSQHSAARHGVNEVSYTLPYGETRKIQWLTVAEAIRRATTLRLRGYKVDISPMAI